jgi:hypothetical protein
MNTTWKKFKLKGGFNNPNNLGLFLDYVLESGLGGGPLGLLIAIIFFFILYVSFLDLGGPAIGLRPRAVWMWDDLVPPPLGSMFESTKVVQAPGAYLAWAKTHCVTETWLDVSGLYDKQAALSNFLKLAKEQGMSTQFLASTSPAVLNYPADAGKTAMEDLLKFIGDIEPAYRPTAIQTDIENIRKNGQTGKYFEEYDDTVKEEDKLLLIEPSAALAALQTYLGMISAANMTAYASVLYWWIPFEAPNPAIPLCTVNGQLLPYGEALFATGWNVTVQDYRIPFATHLVPPAVGWSKLAGKYGRNAYVGLSVGPPAGGAYTYEDAMKKAKNDGPLEKDINMISDACLDEAGFAGMAVHTAAWYGSATGNK